MNADEVSVRPARVSLRSINKSFRRSNGELLKAIDDVDVDVAAGEFLVLLGPSGCGKTTLLRSIAGLERPDSGRIEVNGIPVFDADTALEIAPEKRRIGMVFQSYALWPHMTVRQNVAYPLRMRGVAANEANDRVTRILQTVNIPDLIDQHPGRISGGQQQRVALARALVGGDEIVLFDEPLSNVDAKVREHLRAELLAMQRDLRFTAIYVTHDQEEAMALATNIAVMKAGRVVQLGPPQELYRRPKSHYVGMFLGTTNEMQGKIVQSESGRKVSTLLGDLSVDADNVLSARSDVAVLSRPERWKISLTPPDSGSIAWRGRIKTSAFLGARNEYVVSLENIELKIWTFDNELLSRGSNVYCSIADSGWIVVDPN